MKTLSMIILLLSSTYAFAYNGDGNDKGNGGDSCESRFYQIKNDIYNWIESSGSRSLSFPDDIHYENYEVKMKAKLLEATVECVSRKLIIHDSEKTCINKTLNDGKAKILCNMERFMQTPEADQYSLTHHEYAGLAGFETNRDAVSNYILSNQVTSFLQKSSTRKLAIKKHFSDTSLECYNNANSFKSILRNGFFDVFIDSIGAANPSKFSHIFNLSKEDYFKRMFIKFAANECSWEPIEARLYCSKRNPRLHFKNSNNKTASVTAERIDIYSGIIGIGSNSQQIISINLTYRDDNGLLKQFKESIEYKASFSGAPIGDSTWRLCRRSVN